jgi:hypothetical protein
VAAPALGPRAPTPPVAKACTPASCSCDRREGGKKRVSHCQESLAASCDRIKAAHNESQQNRATEAQRWHRWVLCACSMCEAMPVSKCERARTSSSWQPIGQRHGRKQAADSVRQRPPDLATHQQVSPPLPTCSAVGATSGCSGLAAGPWRVVIILSRCASRAVTPAVAVPPTPAIPREMSPRKLGACTSPKRLCPTCMAQLQGSCLDLGTPAAAVPHTLSRGMFTACSPNGYPARSIPVLFHKACAPTPRPCFRCC